MSPLPKHERKKSLLGQFVRILAREFRIPVMPTGSATWNREDLDKGLEADESFYLGDLNRVADPDNIDLEIDPTPDLAIEIELTRSALDRIGIYGALRVPELWRFNGRTLRVLLLQEDGTYQESKTSPRRFRTCPWTTSPGSPPEMEFEMRMRCSTSSWRGCEPLSRPPRGPSHDDRGR